MRRPSALRPPTRSPALPSLQLSLGVLFLRLILLPSVLSLHCYECFDRSRPCSRFTNCSGAACILYENMPKRTSVAFCLLVSPVARKGGAELAQGCWRDDGTAGVECICTGDFCNIPRDLWASDPNSPPVAGLKMLQRNPFVDYEYLEDERAALLMDGGETAEGRGEQRENIVEDEQLAEEHYSDQQDLMPVELTDYFEWEKRFRGTNKATDPPRKAQTDSVDSHNLSSALPSAEIGNPISSAEETDVATVRQQTSENGTIRTEGDGGLSSAQLGRVLSTKFLLLTIFIFMYIL